MFEILKNNYFFKLKKVININWEIINRLCTYLKKEQLGVKPSVESEKPILIFIELENDITSPIELGIGEDK